MLRSDSVPHPMSKARQASELRVRDVVVIDPPVPEGSGWCDERDRVLTPRSIANWSGPVPHDRDGRYAAGTAVAQIRSGGGTVAELAGEVLAPAVSRSDVRQRARAVATSHQDAEGQAAGHGDRAVAIRGRAVAELAPTAFAPAVGGSGPGKPAGVIGARGQSDEPQASGDDNGRRAVGV